MEVDNNQFNIQDKTDIPLHMDNNGKGYVIVSNAGPCKDCNERKGEYCWNIDCDKLPEGLYAPWGRSYIEHAYLDKEKLRQWFQEVYALYENIIEDKSVPDVIRDGAKIRLEMAVVIGMEIKSGRFNPVLILKN